VENTPWWQSGVIYQIYPRSFQDSDGDGVGDLAGIRRRIPYLRWLGINAIWVSPIFPSPMADFGYDVSDYCDIDPLFGSMDDFDALVRDAHASGLKVILDFVPNHTSDQHPWFLDSRSSRNSKKRDWYIWCEGKSGGQPPNNWISQFGGTAWSWDAQTGQFYLHSFLPQQPDLNWRNDEVRAAMFDVLRFWLERDVDGFRVDVLWLLIKDANLRDNPPNPAYQPIQAEINRTLSIYNADQPEVLDLVSEMRAVLNAYGGERLLIGEIYLPFDRLAAYYGKDLTGAQLPFNFALIHARWNAAAIASLISEYETSLPQGGWPNWVLGNHDQPRIAARVGPAQARVATMLLLMLRGTPTIYYGDEIGMPRVEVSSDLTKDPWELREPGLGIGRDPSRTPMQWDRGPNAGFTLGKPWLPLEEHFSTRNVASQREEARSMLSLTQALITLRGAHDALCVGGQKIVNVGEDVLTFERFSGQERFMIVLNFGPQARPVPPGAIGKSVVLSTLMDCKDTVCEGVRGDEGLLIRLF
jgi:alpha-glucosidase